MNALLQFLIALDQTINCTLFLLPGDTWADESFSARCWRMRHTSVFAVLRKLVDWLFFFQPNHCEKSYLSEKARTQLPIEER